MKTDAQLKQDVVDELAWDPAVRAENVGVAAKDGVVTLTGHLDTYAEKIAVERAVKRVQGVQALAIELDVRLSPQHRRSDTDIAQSAEQALKAQTLAPAEQLRVSVEHGWITLNGRLTWDYQRQAATKAVRSLPGVVGVSNEITLEHKVAPEQVGKRIEQALQRQALREAHRVQVDVEGGKVTLRGTVHSWHERQAAQGAAWSAPGVHTVDNQLRVTAP